MNVLIKITKEFKPECPLCDFTCESSEELYRHMRDVEKLPKEKCHYAHNAIHYYNAGIRELNNLLLEYTDDRLEDT